MGTTVPNNKGYNIMASNLNASGFNSSHQVRFVSTNNLDKAKEAIEKLKRGGDPLDYSLPPDLSSLLTPPRPDTKPLNNLEKAKIAIKKSSLNLPEMLIDDMGNPYDGPTAARLIEIAKKLQDERITIIDKLAPHSPNNREWIAKEWVQFPKDSNFGPLLGNWD